MALAIVTANTSTSASSSCPAVQSSQPSKSGQSWRVLATKLTSSKHSIGSGITTTALCYTVMTWAYLLSPICTAHSTSHRATANLFVPRLDCAVPGDTIYTTLTIKIRGGAASCNKQATTHSIIFIVLHTLNKFASINGDWRPRPIATPTAGPLPDGSCHPMALAAHFVDDNQSVKWSDPKLWLENTL